MVSLDRSDTLSTDQIYDLIVIGSGPAGRRAAIQAAKLGHTVLVVERGQKVGGVSVHTGTIPSKTLRETVLNLSGWRERGFYGRAYRVKKDIEADDLMNRLHITLSHEVDVLEHQFSRNRVRTIHGVARFLDREHVEITTAPDISFVARAARILIAVGTVPHRPDNIPFDGKTVLDSDEIISIPTLPRSLTVIGAGVIGVEYATIFHALDIKVTLVEPRKTILDFIDSELVDDFLHQLRDSGMTIRLGSAVEGIVFENDHPVTLLEGGRRLPSDMVLYAAGRSGAVEGLGLETIGLIPDKRGRLSVNPQTMETSVPGIYAAGDIIGFPSLASTSMEQGRIAACHAFDAPSPPAPDYFPYGIYSVPEMSTVGLTEEQVKERHIPYECGIARFRETSRGHIMGLSNGLMKMIFSLKTRRLLGVHIVGEGATELIHIGQAVLNLHGTLDYFIDNTFNYPTLAEAYKIAALDAWNRMAYEAPLPAAPLPADPVPGVPSTTA
ncbi:Si-specific NAD(P)(+) transhydrogenase [Granulibacter bethesdensis]|uniref:Si-specific NAD(P)(+) transhydrogenase n=1 Tax=Granulibacter bethesdensis TaxID=364410 RepID=UPI0003F201A9|nr:Si-specific NAD(P)(+) transhydrogenase [Granulibacter bethesdensis]AHJ68951.1 Soluble pyridine nucleotide transhydrogenase [Granulibacter bethesdensis]